MPRRRNVPRGMPDYKDLINPTITALQNLGGSANIDEIYTEVIKILNLDDRITDFPHSENGSQNEVQYRLAWARTYLKLYGIISNSSRGVWMILPQYSDIKEVNITDCVNKVRELSARTRSVNDTATNTESEDADITPEIEPWRQKLQRVLLSMNPYGFERLVQRLLRESGFSNVEVTRRSGDGGIDGYGRFKINGIFSFKVAFQCKRYSHSVPASDIRDFRGSLTTDIEKAIFITTSAYSTPAMEEAAKQGKIQIDLMDGEDLMDKLLECGIGVKEVISYEIDEEYFNQLY